MSAWIKCTNTNDKEIWINMDNAVSFTSVTAPSGKPYTKIVFMGAEKENFNVRDSVETILASLTRS